MARIGKIARLPRIIRDQLNQRILDGESGRSIIKWLNALPQVRDVLARDFDSRDINDANLHDWRKAGYLEWCTHQELLRHASDLAADAAEIAGAVPGRVSDHLSAVLAARYAAELAQWTGQDDPALSARLRILHGISAHVAELRRGDHEASRVSMDETRLDRDRQKVLPDVVEYFRRWADFPTVREALIAGAPIPATESDPLLAILKPKPALKPIIDSQGVIGN